MQPVPKAYPLYPCGVKQNFTWVLVWCSKSQLVPKFREYDMDGDGYITLEEASRILQSDPFNFPPSRVTLLLRNFDRDGNGRLDIEEFAGFYAEAKAT